MSVSVNVETVRPRKLAAVRCEVAPRAVGSAWGRALNKVSEFIRSQPGLWTHGDNLFLYRRPALPKSGCGQFSDCVLFGRYLEIENEIGRASCRERV